VDGHDIFVGDVTGRLCYYTHLDGAHPSSGSMSATDVVRETYLAEPVTSDRQGAQEEIICLSVWQCYCVYATSSGSVTALIRTNKNRTWRKVPLKLPADMNRVSCVQIGDDNVVTGGHDGVARLWCLLTGDLIMSYIGHVDNISCVVYDCEQLITGSWDGYTKVWDLWTGALLYTLPRCQDRVWCLSASSEFLVVGALDFSVLVCDFREQLTTVAATARRNRKRDGVVGSAGRRKKWGADQVKPACCGGLLAAAGNESAEVFSAVALQAPLKGINPGSDPPRAVAAPLSPCGCFVHSDDDNCQAAQDLILLQNKCSPPSSMEKQMSVDSWDDTGRASASAVTATDMMAPDAMSVVGSLLFSKPMRINAPQKADSQTELSQL